MRCILRLIVLETPSNGLQTLKVALQVGFDLDHGEFDASPAQRLGRVAAHHRPHHSPVGDEAELVEPDLVEIAADAQFQVNALVPRVDQPAR